MGTTKIPPQAHSCPSSSSRAASTPLPLKQEKPSSDQPSPQLQPHTPGDLSRPPARGPPGTRISPDETGGTRRTAREGPAAPSQRQAKHCSQKPCPCLGLSLLLPSQALPGQRQPAAAAGPALALLLPPPPSPGPAALAGGQR